MAKFKKGDRVRLIGRGHRIINRNDVGTVVKVEDDFVFVNWDIKRPGMYEDDSGHKNIWGKYSNDLEMIKPKTPINKNIMNFFKKLFGCKPKVEAKRVKGPYNSPELKLLKSLEEGQSITIDTRTQWCLKTPPQVYAYMTGRNLKRKFSTKKNGTFITITRNASTNNSNGQVDRNIGVQ